MNRQDVDALTLEQIVELLNGEPAGPEALGQFVERYDNRVGRIPRREENLCRKAELVSRLRSRVHAWLSTGLNADGSESPPNRKRPFYNPYQPMLRAIAGNSTGAIISQIEHDKTLIL